MLNDSLIAFKLMGLCVSSIYVWTTPQSQVELCEGKMQWNGISGSEMCVNVFKNCCKQMKASVLYSVSNGYERVIDSLHTH